MVRAAWLCSVLIVLSASCGQTEPPAPAIEAETGVLIDDYKKNEVAADAKYTNRSVSLTGIVREIGKEKGVLSDQAYLDFGGSRGPRVRCYFEKKDEEQFRDIQKDQEITVKGLCAGVYVEFKHRIREKRLDEKFGELIQPYTFVTLNGCKVVPPDKAKP